MQQAKMQRFQQPCQGVPLDTKDRETPSSNIRFLAVGSTVAELFCTGN